MTKQQTIIIVNPNTKESMLLLLHKMAIQKLSDTYQLTHPQVVAKNDNL